jgi:protein MpaA
VYRQSLTPRIKTLLSKISLKSWIIGGVFLAVLLSYGLIFFIPKSVDFSYASTNCTKQLVIAPDLQKTNSSDFTASFKGGIKLGNISLVASRVCIEPKQALKPGTATATIGLFGSFVASKQFNVTVPEAPSAKTNDIVGKQISTTEPLKVTLTSSDIINKYSLKIADKVSNCSQKAAELSCEVAPLKLEQGATYTASLHQSYKQSSKKIVEGAIETLRPVSVVATSITDGQVLYDAPTGVNLTFDQPIERSTATLVKVTGETTEKKELTQATDGTALKLSFGSLDRESSYRLELTQAIAENGSSLAAPVTISFSTSGGPKVTSVSVGANSVSRSARIIVTFDQPIDASVDIGKLARAEGVAATVTKQSDTQLAFTIQGGDCAAFNLVVDKGLKSGSNGALSKDAWKFASRTICGSAWSIGSSVKGRAIMAYSFGTGSTTILFTGGMHGSEPSGATTMQAWVQYLQAYGDIVPAGKRVVIVPNTNPDGIAVGSRNNSRNVNIDRNFPAANWQAAIETASGTLATGGGASAGSEPETAALIALTRQLRPRLEVSFHAQGRLVGANKVSDSVAIGDIYANTVGYKTMYYDVEAVMGYSITGEYEDWMGESLNIPAILIELPSASGNYLNAQLPALKKMLAV